MSQAEEKLNDLSGEHRSAIVSTDSAETAAADENTAVNGPVDNGAEGPDGSLDPADLDGAAGEAVDGDAAEGDPIDDAESDELVAVGDEEPSVSLADLE